MIAYYMTTVCIYIYTQIAYIVLNSSPFGPAGVLPPSLAVEAVEGMEGMVTSPACGQQKQMETNGLVHYVELAIGEHFLRDGLFVFLSA